MDFLEFKRGQVSGFDCSQGELYEVFSGALRDSRPDLYTAHAVPRIESRKRRAEEREAGKLWKQLKASSATAVKPERFAFTF